MLETAKQNKMMAKRKKIKKNDRDESKKRYRDRRKKKKAEIMKKMQTEKCRNNEKDAEIMKKDAELEPTMPWVQGPLAGDVETLARCWAAFICV
jgi:hypothetical protein